MVRCHVVGSYQVSRGRLSSNVTWKAPVRCHVVGSRKVSRGQVSCVRLSSGVTWSGVTW